MSGIEVAGLVLGGFPLLISAAEHYKEGFQPLRKWYCFRDEFIQFIDAVATQKLLFDQTLERFLISADVPEDELQQLMRNANYKGWHRTDLVDLLKTRLGLAYDVYMSTINRMNKLLLDLQQILLVKNRNGEFEVEWARDGASKWKYQMQRICLSFSKKGNFIVEELERSNKKLAALLESKDKLDNLKATKKDTKWANIFDGIRCHANNLYTVLKKGWNCDCDMAHSTALRLQHRKTAELPSDFNMCFSVPKETFKLDKMRKEVLIKIRKPKEEQPVVSVPSPIPDKDEYLTKLRRDFEPQVSITARPGLNSASSDSASSSTRSSLREIFTKYSHNISSPNGSEIILVEKTTTKWSNIRSQKSKKSVRMDLPVEMPLHSSQQSPPVTEVHVELETITEIKDLCSILYSHPPNITCLGYLGNESTQQYELRYTCSPLPDDDSSQISLEALLNNEEGITFSRQQRYKIASVLASSLLQLQTTPWLQEKLDKKNIIFYRQGTDVFFDHPYIRHDFKSVKKPEPMQSQPLLALPPRFAARNSLNNLGTLLLELCFGKPVEKCELRKYHLGVDGKAHERTNWSTTRDWAEKVSEEDPRLESIINCCVFDVFLQHKPDWESKSFIQAVYLSVVEPLDKLNTMWVPSC